MRKLAFLATVFAVFSFANLASAQQGDAFLGFGTLLSPGAAPCGFAGFANYVCPEKGGLYMNLGGDVIFHRRIGFGFDANWRAGEGNFGGLGQPYRPIQYAFNGIFQPKLSKKAGLDLLGGIGWQSTRFYGYQNTYSCYALGACYSSANHFLLDAGAGIRYYVWGHVFLRPEVRYYHVTNNSDFFSSGNLVRVGGSIGYTIGPD